MKPIQSSRFMSAASSGGMKVQFYVEEPGKTVTATTVLDQAQEGPPGHVHGGVLTALIDEAMGAAVWQADYKVVAANLNIDFRAPAPLGVELSIMAKIDRIEGRKIIAVGHVKLPDGRIAVEGRGIFVEAPHLFEGADGFQKPFRTRT